MIVDQSGGKSFFGYSRFISCVWDSPEIFQDEDRYFSELLIFLEQHPEISIVFPIGDSQIRLLARKIDDIPARVKLIMPDSTIIETCHDKLTMSRNAEKLGIPQMPFSEVNSFKELKQRAREIGYPCVIRPTNCRTKILGGKVFICKTEEQLNVAFKDWSFTDNSCFVQRHASGVRHNLYFLAEKGRLVCCVEVKIIRTDCQDGTGLAVESVTVESSAPIVAMGKKWIEYFDYTGLGCMQCLVDSKGCPENFLEINPRLGAAIALTYSSGVDFPKMAVRQALGTLNKAEEDIAEYKTGVRFGWLHGDLLGLIGESKNLTVRENLDWFFSLCSTFVHARSHPTWSFFDPLPSLLIYAHSVKQLTRKLLKR